MRSILLAGAALALSGCVSTYQLALMPRDSGKIYSGVATDTGAGEGPMSVTIESTTYNGTWVRATPDYGHAWVSGGYGYGYGRRWGGVGGSMIMLDNPQGSESKALLTAADGSGLRCDFRNGQGKGAGMCRDDRGREYDVQLRLAQTTNR